MEGPIWSSQQWAFAEEPSAVEAPATRAKALIHVMNRWVKVLPRGAGAGEARLLGRSPLARARISVPARILFSPRLRARHVPFRPSRSTGPRHSELRAALYPDHFMALLASIFGEVDAKTAGGAGAPTPVVPSPPGLPNKQVWMDYADMCKFRLFEQVLKGTKVRRR
jgi:hypothetical protein